MADLLRVPWPHGTTLAVCVLGDDLPKSLQERERLMRERLADLIDPTCEVTVVGEWPWATCDACGTKFQRYQGRRLAAFCPVCGARRVLDDGITYSTGGDE